MTMTVLAIVAPIVPLVIVGVYAVLALRHLNADTDTEKRQFTANETMDAVDASLRRSIAEVHAAIDAAMNRAYSAEKAARSRSDA